MYRQKKKLEAINYFKLKGSEYMTKNCDMQQELFQRNFMALSFYVKKERYKINDISPQTQSNPEWAKIQ